MDRAFQDLIPGIHCFGCGPDNPEGLRIKSYWSGEKEAICCFVPRAHHIGPPRIVNGGIIATVIDCHSVCTAIADAYKRAGRGIGEGGLIPYVTGTLKVTYLAPTPIDAQLEAKALILLTTDKKTVVECTITANGVVTAKGEVIAVRVPGSLANR
jgi:acyl-coenzyme A thioesterase PaaI-like protein